MKFKQKPKETLYHSWERFTESFFNCPEHKLNEHEHLQIFYQGLDVETRKKLDFRGPIPRMTPSKGIEAIKEISGHSFLWHDEYITKVNTGGGVDKLKVVFEYIKDFEHSMKFVTEEVRMAQHRFDTPIEGRVTSVEKTLNKFVKESFRK
ncbi:hypothetical protein Tco_0155767 [Tanacetum coccineum]